MQNTAENKKNKFQLFHVKVNCFVGKMGRIEKKIKKVKWTNIRRDKALRVEVPLKTFYHTR